jgi:hypothetical protein
MFTNIANGASFGVGKKKEVALNKRAKKTQKLRQLMLEVVF